MLLAVLPKTTCQGYFTNLMTHLLIPRQIHAEKPAVVIEPRKGKDAQGEIDQIKRKEYVKALEDYKGNLPLVGINYGKDRKTYLCDRKDNQIRNTRKVFVTLRASVILWILIYFFVQLPKPQA